MELAQNRNTDQWNKIENAETMPHNFSHLVFDKKKKPKSITGEKIASFTEGAAKTNCVEKSESVPVSLTLFQTETKMYQRHRYNNRSTKSARR